MNSQVILITSIIYVGILVLILIGIGIYRIGRNNGYNDGYKDGLKRRRQEPICNTCINNSNQYRGNVDTTAPTKSRSERPVYIDGKTKHKLHY